MIEPITAKDIMLASACIGMAAAEKPMNKPTLLHLATIEAGKAEISVEELRGPRRFKYLVEPRQAFMLAAREEGYSYPRIAHFLRRDHTSIVHGVRRAKARREAGQSA